MNGPIFSLHPQLAADCIVLGDLPLSRVLLMNDSQYPWIILVPRQADLREIYDLNALDQGRLMRESSQTAEAMMRLFSGHKCNVAALGNVVPQLHIHHIVRHQNDPAWPKPVWGVSPAIAYSDDVLAERSAQLVKALSLTKPA